MLTDEERNDILDVYMHDDGCSIHDMCKAIERAVLAKAMPIPKQEPVEKILADMKDQQKNAWLAVCKVLDEVNPEWLKFGKKGTDCAVDAIRSLSQPAQAAAIPDAWREIVADLANELESEVMAKYTLETLKYQSQKNKFDADMDSVHRARALLSASPKSE